MDNKSKRKQQRVKEKNEFIILIILLLLLLAVLIFVDKKFSMKVKSRPYEGEIQTYDGFLQRNLSNPLGLE